MAVGRRQLPGATLWLLLRLPFLCLLLPLLLLLLLLGLLLLLLTACQLALHVVVCGACRIVHGPIAAGAGHHCRQCANRRPNRCTAVDNKAAWCC
jgi:hypothetical protein